MVAAGTSWSSFCEIDVSYFIMRSGGPAHFPAKFAHLVTVVCSQKHRSVSRKAESDDLVKIFGVRSLTVCI